MKLLKVVQSHGFGSKKQSEFLIKQGLVKIDKKIITDPNFLCDLSKNPLLEVDGEETYAGKHVYVMLNKPENYETSHKPVHYPPVFMLLPNHWNERGLQAVGRLDADTTGLLLLTDDGQFIHQMSSGKKLVEKLYIVGCKHEITQALIDSLLAGVLLHDENETIAASQCIQLDSHQLKLGITSGKYHQVKRMIAAAGNRVETLHREAVGDYVLPADLQPGQWRQFFLD